VILRSKGSLGMRVEANPPTL